MEETIRYTDCKNSAGKPCSEEISNKTAEEKSCTCSMPFTISNDWKGKVFMYYELENFYQNHRRYVKSRDDKQLLGELGTVDTECKPFDTCVKSNKECQNGINRDLKDGTSFLPCGAIANSLFSGEFIITMIISFSL